NVWRDDEWVSPHLPTPLPRRSERLAKDLLEGEALAAGREVPPAAPDLPHERRIAQHVEGRLETLVLREVHQHRSRLAFARHHDLFLTLLDAGQQLREVRLHLGDWQGASHAACLHVDQNSGRRVSRLCKPINPARSLSASVRVTQPRRRPRICAWPPRRLRFSPWEGPPEVAMSLVSTGAVYHDRTWRTQSTTLGPRRSWHRPG